MKNIDNYENKKVKTNEKEQRSLMYSQIFNYNMVSRDPMERDMEVTSSIENAGKSITNKKEVVIAFLFIVIFVITIVRCFW